MDTHASQSSTLCENYRNIAFLQILRLVAVLPDSPLTLAHGSAS